VPRLSIIIPVVGDPRQLDDTLVSVLENRPLNCEIVVVHNQPYHDPYQLSDEVRFVEAKRGAGMAECLNCGLDVCRSAVVHVLSCDVEVCPGWADAALRHFGNPATAAVAAVVVDSQNRERIVSAGWGYRVEGTAWRVGQDIRLDGLAACQLDLCGPDTLAAFYRRSVLQTLGGFASWAGDAWPGIDLALALRCDGLRCVMEPRCLTHVTPAAARIAPAFRYGRNAERLFWRWASTHGRLRSSVGHVALLAGQCVVGLWHPSKLIQLFGRMCGLVQAACFDRRAKPIEAPPSVQLSVINSPHFTVVRQRKEQRSSRVA
jgi:hypothetical protein